MRKLNRLLYFVLFALLVLLLAGCGGEGETNEIEIGATAPGFSLANAAGGEVSLADYAGKPVLLYFHMAVG